MSLIRHSDRRSKIYKTEETNVLQSYTLITIHYFNSSFSIVHLSTHRTTIKKILQPPIRINIVIFQPETFLMINNILLHYTHILITTTFSKQTTNCVKVVGLYCGAHLFDEISNHCKQAVGTIYNLKFTIISQRLVFHFFFIYHLKNECNYYRQEAKQ